MSLTTFTTQFDSTAIEFVGGTNTVTIVNDLESEFEILNVDGTINNNAVTYSHPNGRVYPGTKLYYQTSSPHLLPPNDPVYPELSSYTGIYQLIPPSENFVTITWTIMGRERVSESNGSGGEGGGTSEAPEFGSWQQKTYTWTMEVAHNYVYTATAIKNAVKDGTGYQKTILTYPEAIL
jgi:hypothetical protein